MSGSSAVLERQKATKLSVELMNAINYEGVRENFKEKSITNMKDLKKRLNAANQSYKTDPKKKQITT